MAASLTHLNLNIQEKFLFKGSIFVNLHCVFGNWNIRLFFPVNYNQHRITCWYILKWWYLLTFLFIYLLDIFSLFFSIWNTVKVESVKDIIRQKLSEIYSNYGDIVYDLEIPSKGKFQTSPEIFGIKQWFWGFMIN